MYVFKIMLTTLNQSSGAMSCLYSICHSKWPIRDLNAIKLKMDAQKIGNREFKKHEPHPLPAARECASFSVFHLYFSPTLDSTCPHPNSVYRKLAHSGTSITLSILPLQPSLAWKACLDIFSPNMTLYAVLSGEFSPLFMHCTCIKPVCHCSFYTIMWDHS